MDLAVLLISYAHYFTMREVSEQNRKELAEESQ